MGELLRQSSEHLATAEAELAVCEFSGCPGVTADIDSAITHSRKAAERGSIDALLSIGPHLSAGQMDPDEVSAWSLMHASLEQQGCAGNGFSVESMKSTIATLTSNSITDEARILANQYWQDYAGQIMSSVGCTP